MLHILKLRLNTMLTRTDFQTSCRVSESIQNAQTHSWPWLCERQHIHPSLLMSLSTTTIEKCYYCERKALKSCCFCSKVKKNCGKCFFKQIQQQMHSHIVKATLWWTKIIIFAPNCVFIPTYHVLHIFIVFPTRNMHIVAFYEGHMLCSLFLFLFQNMLPHCVGFHILGS